MFVLLITLSLYLLPPAVICPVGQMTAVIQILSVRRSDRRYIYYNTEKKLLQGLSRFSQGLWENCCAMLHFSWICTIMRKNAVQNGDNLRKYWTSPEKHGIIEP
jgi:hypothetical protein